MGTLSEEIFSQRLGRTVEAGELVVASLDLVMSHDTTTPLAIEAFSQLRDRVWDPTRIAIALDHVWPPATIASATLQRTVRNFVAEQEHPALLHRGRVPPGDRREGARATGDDRRGRR
jgi:homoaconitase/3-isopropylmalate dehydratase large subunit